jgi:hypothetical protein
MTKLRNIPTKRQRQRRALLVQVAFWLALDLFLAVYVWTA